MGGAGVHVRYIVHPLGGRWEGGGSMCAPGCAMQTCLTLAHRRPTNQTRPASYFAPEASRPPVTFLSFIAMPHYSLDVPHPATSAATCDSILPAGLSSPNSTCEIMGRRLTRPLRIATIAVRAGPEAELENRFGDEFIRSWKKSAAMHGSYNRESYRPGVLASFPVFFPRLLHADGVRFLA